MLLRSPLKWEPSLQAPPRPPKGKTVGDKRCSLEAMIVHPCRRANGEVPPIHPSAWKGNSRKCLGQKPMASSKIYGILKKVLLLWGAKRPHWKVGERRPPNDQRSQRPQRAQQPPQDDAHARGGSRERLCRRASRPRSLSAVNGWLEPGQWRGVRRRLHGGRRSRRLRRHTLQGASGDRSVPPATLR